MGRTGSARCPFSDGWSIENIPDCQGTRTTALAKERSDGFVRFVGTSELLGALGLILPLVTGILPWLTVLATIGLTLIQLMAIFTEHLPKKEHKVIPVNFVLLALAVFVVVGRWATFS